MTRPDFTWDEEASAAYLDLSPETSHRWNKRPVTLDAGITVVIDEDEDGEIVGLEILL